MIKTTLNIGHYAIRVGITHKGPHSHDKILPMLREVAGVRIGSKISRLARLVLTQARITKRFIATNLVAVILATNVLIPGASAFGSNEAETVAIDPALEPVSTTVVRRLPVDNFIVSQGYHFFHPALDIDGVTGDTIYPIMNGRIESVSREFFLGKTVRVDHGNGIKSVYAHLENMNVKSGQEVTTDTQLGEMGSTGHSFGDHLHLEVSKNGKNINPHSILPPKSRVR